MMDVLERYRSIREKLKDFDCVRLSMSMEELEQTIKQLEQLSPNEYQRLAARTINNELTGNEKVMHALFGMVGEIGEIHSIFQKVYQGHELDQEHIKKELGDLLWFIAEFCTVGGVTLEEIMQMNIDKLKARYPDGFKEENSLNREKGDI